MPSPTNDPTERLNLLPDFRGRESLYHPLDANKHEIRVITVRPSEGRSSAIHCYLQTISIQDGQSTKPYDAISYFWGSTATTEAIIVHYESPGDQAHDCGFEVPVTQALTGALRQFRARATESGEPLALWTDAVCINQRDTAERSQQVSRMRKVYRAAASVMIWLGEGDPVAETGLVNLFGLAMCRQAGNAERDHSLDAFDYSAYDATPDMENLERMNAILKIFGNRNSEPEIDEALSVYMTLWVQAVSTLLELPYWYRGWTFQEASSNENIVLHYGDSRCRVRRWDLVADVTNQDMKQLLFITQPERPHLLPLPNFLIWAYRVHTARFFAGLYNDPRWKFDLATIIACVKGEIGVLQSSSTQTTDPRDQIYSRIGSGPGFAHLKIEPDYSLTTEQVFIATTVAILQASQSWSHAYFFDTSRSPFMPSWSIDFTLPRDWESLFFDRPREASTRHTTDGSASFCLYEGQPGTLFTAGFIYDEIAIVEPRNQLESMMTVKKWILKFNSRLGHWHQSLGRTAMLTMGDPWEAICRVMCLGIVGKDKFESRHATACQRWLHEQVADDDMLPVLQSMNYMPKRKAMSIIITRNGRMGLARRDANVGDHIAILATGSMPFVLRKVRERDDNGCAYILLGACYVDNIMYGEAVRQEAKDIYETRRRCDPDFALWKRKHRDLIGWDHDLGVLSFSSDLAFLDDICLF